jgi:molecular chaperone DnaK
MMNDSEIYEFGAPALLVRKRSKAHCTNSKIQGVVIENKSVGDFKNCELAIFEDSAYFADEDSKVTLHHCVIEGVSEETKRKRIFAIDLGFTTTRVCYLEDDKFSRIFSFPSFLAYKDGEWEVGSWAKALAVTTPHTFSGLIQGVLGDETFLIDDQEYKGEQLLGTYVKYVKNLIEETLGERIESCVVTSSNLDNVQFVDALKDTLSRYSGLEVERVIGQAKALGLAYGMDKEAEETILLVNISGSSLNIVVMDIGDGVFEVINHSEHFELGQDQFDLVIVHHLVNEVQKEHDYDLLKDPMTVKRLKQAAEQAKLELTKVPSTRIFIPNVFNDGVTSYNIDTVLTREEFEELSSGLIEEIKVEINKILADYNLDQIDKTLLGGGASQMPMMRNLFDTNKNVEILPEDSAVKGGAILAGILAGEIKDMVFLDTTGHSINILTKSGSVAQLMKPYSTLPVSGSTVFTTTRDHQTTMDFQLLMGPENKPLAFFQVDNLPKAPAGDLQLMLTVEIDKNHVLRSTVRDLDSGNVLKQVTLTESMSKGPVQIENAIEMKKQKSNDDTMNITSEERKEMEALLEEFISLAGVEKAKQTLEKYIDELKRETWN